MQFKSIGLHREFLKQQEVWNDKSIVSVSSDARFEYR